ncbi:MAG: F0F1 ATP synthase subunit B [Flavobacteriales bacterium]|nr:F0F1 ATP synthase subunit B [Flavobacteriales bacterium]MBT6747168.1 F0F1 ATP synthase subunit B [Flavobacteriales bacterium]
MSLITPDIGLLFWMFVSFGIVLFILKKFAWKPILDSVKEREDSIEEALAQAGKAKEELEKLQANNEDLLKQAREERDLLIKEAREAKDNMISEAKGQAKDEADKILVSARETIESEKIAAVAELKSQVAVLSIEIAEKILRDELSTEDKQKKLVNNLLEDVNLN